MAFDVYFLTFAIEFKSVKLSHTFKYFSGGSWVAFSPIPSSEKTPESDKASESTSATASVELPSRPTSYYGDGNRSSLLLGTCHHNDGTTHTLPVGQVCPDVGSNV